MKTLKIKKEEKKHFRREVRTQIANIKCLAAHGFLELSDDSPAEVELLHILQEVSS